MLFIACFTNIILLACNRLEILNVDIIQVIIKQVLHRSLVGHWLRYL